jgi:hypothetical protein
MGLGGSGARELWGIPHVGALHVCPCPTAEVSRVVALPFIDEGPQDQPMTKHDFDYDGFRLEPSLESDRAPDAAGYWFLAAVLFAFIAAGIIVYRGGNTEMQTAANYRAAAQSDPIASPPIVPR